MTRIATGATTVTAVLGLVALLLVVPPRNAAFTASSVNAANSFAVATTFDGSTLYLHNNPTPPIGNTTMQDLLPLDATTPTATLLYNYATDVDSDPGRTIEEGTVLSAEPGSASSNDGDTYHQQT